MFLAGKKEERVVGGKQKASHREEKGQLIFIWKTLARSCAERAGGGEGWSGESEMMSRFWDSEGSPQFELGKQENLRALVGNCRLYHNGGFCNCIIL